MIFLLQILIPKILGLGRQNPGISGLGFRDPGINSLVKN